MIKHLRSVCLILLVFSLVLVSGCAAAEKSILLTFTGDCTLGSEEATRPREDSFDSLAASKGYDYFFDNFRTMFENDDQTVINFEGVLSDNKFQESRTKRYRFRGPTEFVKILTGSSIEACSLANNHIGDFGKQGEESTKATLDANNIGWFQNYKYYIYEKEGIKVAFIALENRTVYKEFEKIKKMITKLKETGEANAIVVCWHTGLEYRGAHETNTESTSQALIRYGADLVVITHPHVLQGIQVYNNRCIFYSLGNFVFGGNSAIRTEKFKIDQTVTSLYSMVVQVKLLFTNDGKYLGQLPVIYPVYTSSAAPVNNYQPYRANAEEAEAVRAAIQQDSGFQLPEITTDADGLSRMEMDYLAAFDGVGIPESEDDGPQGKPEASNPSPTRKNKGQ
ncbi:MAG: CapA family protein [Clostridia bacterium]|nr:CapA family protein [Clostridia bacterium]